MSSEISQTPDRVGGVAYRKKVLPWARSRQLERDLEHVNREIYRQNLELALTNKTLSLLNAIDLIVLQPDSDLYQVCVKVVNSMVKNYDAYVFAALFCKAQEDSRKQTLLAWAYDWENSEAGKEPTAKFVKTLTPRRSFEWKTKGGLFDDGAEVAKLLKTEPELMRQFAHDLKIHHFFATQLVGVRGAIGTLIIGLRDEAMIHDPKLLNRVGDAVGMALDNKLLQEENRRILLRLESSNAKLRLLDRTKDDFISMASHQLRTPLTSVKGYVSMVLDGDAGKISDLQRKLLNQAFVSSQRMAYLISDLLNVSRLRTGKFVIEPTSLNLAEVIGQEVEQLIETVKSRGLEINYHKPENFPNLMLDDTKMRQVIMNFVDNAVYYTPSGGHIDIYLEEKPETIEFTVVDDGIGVPKTEQHRLFSKFYRAHNAKRARPDGTGLGIFMAKKVIIAQGGAVIFRSAEGRGSTFGFTFPKAKLLPPEPDTAPAQPADNNK
jgi:signal transduction histidine kinase